MQTFVEGGLVNADLARKGVYKIKTMLKEVLQTMGSISQESPKNLPTIFGGKHSWGDGKYSWESIPG